MTYRPLLTPGELYDLTYFTNGERHIVTVPVGETDRPPMVYSVAAALFPTPLLPRPGSFEFGFYVIEFDVKRGTEHRYLSGLDTKGKVPDDHRSGCINVVCDALTGMLNEVQPKLIFMQACDANLPLPARRKYEIIIETFGRCGYQVERQPAYHGRDSWLMERLQS